MRVLILLIGCACALLNREAVLEKAKLLTQKLSKSEKKRNVQTSTERVMSMVMSQINDASGAQKTKIQNAYNSMETYAAEHPAEFEKSAKAALRRESLNIDERDIMVKDPDMIAKVRAMAANIMSKRK